LYFASEVKAMFAADPALARRLDAAGLDQLFTFWTPVAPRTVFEGITELEPGTVRTYVHQTIRNSRSWEANYPTSSESGFNGSLDEAVEQVRDALETATSLRMLRADVPVGSYLSGGIDSSLIRCARAACEGLEVLDVSLSFCRCGCDETPCQRTMAEHLGSDHHEVMVTRSDIAGLPGRHPRRSVQFCAPRQPALPLVTTSFTKAGSRSC
jgi:asparagine synthase (glutamine-hydrolysing)